MLASRFLPKSERSIAAAAMERNLGTMDSIKPGHANTGICKKKRHN
jgi:hypothetical protein